ncbi:MAG: BON domain-containing protein [Chloroflexi bacterium]|nr:BON domain-containing protein [Chloroflexota bacterium]
MERGSLAARIAQELAEQLDVHVVVEDADGVIVLSGGVDSPEAREAAERVAARMAPGRRIENDLEVETTLPEVVTEEIGGIEPDFTSLPLDVVGAVEERREASDGREEEQIGHGAVPFFPPTDPVIGPGPRGEIEVIGGFTPTSMDSLEVEASAEDEVPGDEAIADAVRRELREDALTTDFEIRVYVQRGVVHLRGTVPSVEDALNAEEVAARVPGVVEVREELEVSGL